MYILYMQLYVKEYSTHLINKYYLYSENNSLLKNNVY